MSEDAFIAPHEIITSDWPANIIPAGARILSAHEAGCTVKGFFDPATGQIHIQEIEVAHHDKSDQ